MGPVLMALTSLNGAPFGKDSIGWHHAEFPRRKNRYVLPLNNG